VVALKHLKILKLREMDHNVVFFIEKRHFLVKIAQNIGHNVDPNYLFSDLLSSMQPMNLICELLPS
jgi:hypothetical protein